MRLVAGVACLALAAPVLVGCFPTTRQPAPVPEELAWTIEQSTPTDVTTQLDAAGAVSAVIPVSGGTLTATGADGTSYTLTIPADALRVATEVTLTPVASTTGLPFGETASYGVDIGPDGTELDAFATIQIVPATPIPGDQQVLYQYRGSGDDLAFALPTPDATGISISTDHFSGYGTAATAPNVVQEEYRLGGDAARAIMSELAHRIQTHTQPRADGSRPPIDPDDLQPFLDLFRDYVLEPRIAHATDSCAAGVLAARTYGEFQRHLALLGMSPQPDGRLPGLVTTMAKTCIDQEYSYCRDEHLTYRILPLYVAMIRAVAVAGDVDPSVDEELRAKVVDCLSFRLDFTSEAVVEGDSGWASAVEASVDLTFDLDGIDAKTGSWKPQFREASTELVNTSVSAEQAGWSGCTATATPSDGEFFFYGMELLASGYDAMAVESGPQRVGRLDDVRLRFGTTVAGGDWQVTCPDYPFQPPAISGIWYVTFLGAHADDLIADQSQGGIEFTGWEPGAPGNATIATREWTATGDRVHETGTLTLVHTPR
ncbi:hypothetical protein D7I47_07260 [Protaetiibacter intestinalis]|uniref:Uncharacterized protein n=1 Tax=Protaetiibacter intestinalis TaxID=2419774 RepID=A0A387B3D5_9MICO|nr:hypothetical protein D7I47_07260 [Protaetiibacter intestinalis]